MAGSLYDLWYCHSLLGVFRYLVYARFAHEGPLLQRGGQEAYG